MVAVYFVFRWPLPDELLNVLSQGSGTIYKPKGSSYRWVAYESGGKRQFESTKSTRKQDAQAPLTQRLGGLVVTPKMGKITVGAALPAVVDNQRMKADGISATRASGSSGIC